MPNAIKYSTSAQTLALKKGNFWIGTGDVGKGPTSTTDYYNGITPPSGGYTIYLNKASGGPSIYTAANDSQLISLSNTIAGQTFATAAAALAWFATQTDKMVFNRDYESIVTNGLVLNLDAGFTPSYPTTGTTWYDVSSGVNNGSLTNGPTYSSSNGGSIVFDGVDDYVTGSCSLTGQNITVNLWCYPTTTGVNKTPLTNQIYDGSTTGYAIQQRSGGYFWVVIGSWGVSGDIVDGIPYTINQWINLVLTYNGATISAYKNGSLFGTTPSTRTFSAGSLVIGAGERAQSEYFQGNIAISQIYSRALTAAEVLQNYNAQKSRFGL